MCFIYDVQNLSDVYQNIPMTRYFFKDFFYSSELLTILAFSIDSYLMMNQLSKNLYLGKYFNSNNNNNNFIGYSNILKLIELFILINKEYDLKNNGINLEELK